MRTRLATLVALSLTLDACSAFPGAVQRAVRTTAIGQNTLSKPSTPPPATPTPSPSVPSAPMTLISGSLQIDADYVIAAGGANLANGAVSLSGGSVIAAGGANVIAAGGANVIAAGGANVIAAGGANVIAAGGANYRLADAAPPFPIGTLAPVKGMGVVPISLVTGKVLGAPVFTDARGHYSVAVPQAEAEAHNVLLVASVPGKDTSDPVLKNSRLQYQLLVSPSAHPQENAIDEDTTLVTAYIRQCFVARLTDWLNDPENGTTALLDGLSNYSNSGAAYMTMLNGLLKDLDDAAIGFKGAPPAVRQAMATRMSDRLLADVQLGSIQMNSPYNTWTPNPSLHAIDGMIQVLQAVRQKAAQDLATPGFSFDTQPYMQTYVASLPAGQTFHVIKPSDLNQFMIDAYLSQNSVNAFTACLSFFKALGVVTGQEPPVTDLNALLQAATGNLFSTIGTTLILNQGGAKDDVIQLLKSSSPGS